MITIDGAAGEGGGQVLRNALALSLVTGQAFQITDIRGRREKPGLMRQHLTAVEAACAVGSAQCDGATVGARTLVFRPGPVRAGEYRFAIGTAGSACLVLQTVLMPLLCADKTSRLVLEGGTHNMAAPTFDFIDQAFLPLVNRMGPRVEARLIRHGFYPRGGGRIEVDIHPAPLRPIDIADRGALRAVGAVALIAGLPPDIAARKLQTVRHYFDWADDAYRVQMLDADRGPGTVLLLKAVFDHTTEIVSAVGKIGVTAESLAAHAAQRLKGFLDSTAAVGPYLADQLLLPLALAGGGCFTTVKPSQHALTAADVIALFLGRQWRFADDANGGYMARWG